MQIEINEMNALLIKALNGDMRGYKSVISGTEYDTDIQVYDLGRDGLFLKVVTTTDSYGSEYVSSIQFVEPKVTSVTDYQPIK
jgi:hypothetical protein